MRIGLDFDGVLSREIAFPKWLPILLARWLLVFAPEMAGLKVARRLGRKHCLVVVTSRPVKHAFVMRLWLWLHRVPCAALYLVGKTGDKVPVLLKERIEVFFDDKPRYVEAASRGGITSHLFQSWDQVAEVLGLADEAQELNVFHRFFASSAVGSWMRKQVKLVLRAFAARSKKLQSLRAELESSPVCANGVVGRESVSFRKLTRPLTAYHATSALGERVIARKGLMPKAILGQETEQTPVVFFYLDRGVAQAFSLLGRWPFRFLFNFRIAPKTAVLEVIVPAGARVNITSWYEVVSLDPVPPVKSRAAKRDSSLDNGENDAAFSP